MLYILDKYAKTVLILPSFMTALLALNSLELTRNLPNLESNDHFCSFLFIPCVLNLAHIIWDYSYLNMISLLNTLSFAKEKYPIYLGHFSSTTSILLNIC